MRRGDGLFYFFDILLQVLKVCQTTVETGLYLAQLFPAAHQLTLNAV